MKIEFWGTRGSLPVAMRGENLEQRVQKILKIANGKPLNDDSEIAEFMKNELPFSLRHSYGGSSSCVQIHTETEEFVLCDMGSGLREFGQRLIRSGELGKPNVFHFFLSHLHWDHIMGFPFFAPAYVPGNTIHIHGCHDVLESALKNQQSDPSFPAHWEILGADIQFHVMQPGQNYDVAGIEVQSYLQHHHGDSYGYRFSKKGKSVVYSTDAEHKLDDAGGMDSYVEFIWGASLVIFDAMYSLADLTTIKEDWGHSSNIVGIDLCRRANVDNFCLFHHEPMYDDEMIEKVLNETIRYEEITREDKALQVSSAYDGMVIEL